MTTIIQRVYIQNMTTIRDYARDLVLETQNKLHEHLSREIIRYDKVTQIDLKLPGNIVEELVDEFVEIIKNRITG